MVVTVSHERDTEDFVFPDGTTALAALNMLANYWPIAPSGMFLRLIRVETDEPLDDAAYLRGNDHLLMRHRMT